jgi:hypothetical protein
MRTGSIHAHESSKQYTSMYKASDYLIEADIPGRTWLWVQFATLCFPVYYSDRYRK